MGSLVSPIAANLHMEQFEGEALQSAAMSPRYKFRFVDDTFVIQQQPHKQLFLDHISNTDPAIRFKVEGNQENGSIPFLDTLVNLRQTSSYPSLCTASPPILTSTYSGKAIIIFLLSTVS